MARARRKTPPPDRLILDSGAVLALARAQPRARAFVARALEVGSIVEVPGAVVAETIRGNAKDAPVYRVLKAIDRIPDTTVEIGRIAGRLLGQTGSSSTIDALVVAQAVQAGGAHILTGDPDDLERLAEPHSNVWIHAL